MDTQLSIKQITVNDRGYSYLTFMVEGKGKFGERVRKKFRSREAALEYKNDLEIEISNCGHEPRRIVSRLTNDQIQDAELAVATLGGKATLLEAAKHYQETYREPASATPLSAAIEAFLAERTKPSSTFYVRPRSMKQCRSVWSQFRAYVSTYHGGDIPVHKLDRSMAIGFLKRTDHAKTFCNWHSELNQFFVFCLDPERGWVTGNPISSITRPRILPPGIPAVLSLERVQQVMEYVAAFPGTSKRTLGKPGQLVPYFALALFAGIRTDDDGEMVKIARSPDAFSKIIDLKRMVIRITAEISKTGQPRAVKVRPCLSAWLRQFPGRILPVNHDKDIAHVRKKFGIGRDVMRHTWYSMRVIAFRSVADAALEGGSTEAVVRRHYLNMQQHTREEALAFWKVVPAVPLTNEQAHAAVIRVAETAA